MHIILYDYLYSREFFSTSEVSRKLNFGSWEIYELPKLRKSGTSEVGRKWNVGSWGKVVYHLGKAEFLSHGEAVDGPNKGPAHTEPKATFKVKLDKPGNFI
jgi:hypothetical protein